MILRDVSDRVAAERQREALAHSETVRALGRMAAGVAHDLSQSLMLIASYSEHAKKAWQRSSPGRSASTS